MMMACLLRRTHCFQSHDAAVILAVSVVGQLQLGALASASDVAPQTPAVVAAAAAASRIRRPCPGNDATERVCEGRLERVVGERVQKWIDGAVGVTEDGEELEQEHLVRGQLSGHVEHDVYLYTRHAVQVYTARPV